MSIKAKGKDYVLECDDCGAESPPFAMGAGQPSMVSVEGWHHEDGVSTCPKCLATPDDDDEIVEVPDDE